MRLVDLFPVHSGWRLMLRDLGINPANVLRRACLPADLFVRDDSTVSTDEYFELWRALEKEADDPLIGIRIGEAISVEMFDPPLFAAICSQNLNMALLMVIGDLCPANIVQHLPSLCYKLMTENPILRLFP